MKPEILQYIYNFDRYLAGKSMPAETRQLQTGFPVRSMMQQFIS
jgi:hypothetical protein